MNKEDCIEIPSLNEFINKLSRTVFEIYQRRCLLCECAQTDNCELEQRRRED